MRIVVLCGWGRTGATVVNQAIGRGHEVVAYGPRLLGLPEHPRLDVVFGRLGQVGHLARACAGADSVIWCLGSPSAALGVLRAHPLQLWWLPGVVETLRRARVPRIVMLAPPAAKERAGRLASGALSFQFGGMSPVFAEDSSGEDVVAKSGLDWTVVRVARISDRLAHSPIAVEPLAPCARPRGSSWVNRADVARVLVTAAEAHAWSRSTVVVRPAAAN